MREFANEILQIYSVTISFCYHGIVLSDSILCFLALSFLFYITRTYICSDNCYDIKYCHLFDLPKIYYPDSVVSPGSV